MTPLLIFGALGALVFIAAGLTGWWRYRSGWRPARVKSWGTFAMIATQWRIRDDHFLTIVERSGARVPGLERGACNVLACHEDGVVTNWTPVMALPGAGHSETIGVWAGLLRDGGGK